MISHRKGVLLDGIGAELIRSANGGRRKTLSQWLANISDEIATTFSSGDATPSVLNGTQFITAGSTPITDFDDAVEGQVIYVYRGGSDITITRNASFIETLDAISITLTVTHPMAAFRSVSGIWQEVERSDSVIKATGGATKRLSDWQALINNLGSTAISSAWATIIQQSTLALGLSAAGLGTEDSPTFTGITLSAATINGRLTIDPNYAAYDQFANVEAAMISFGAGSQTIAANKQLDLIRADNSWTVGAGGSADFCHLDLTAASGCDATADVRGYVANMHNNGPATVSGGYDHVAGAGTSVGAIIAHKFLVTPGASTATSWGLQIAFDSTSHKVDQGIHFNSNAGSNGVDYCIVADTTVKINTAFIQGAAVGAGAAFIWKDATASSDLITIAATGSVTSASFMTGTVLTGTTSLIASSPTNGITITAGNVTRNAAAGSLVIEAGTNAGNSIAFKTNNATKLSIGDSALTANVNIVPVSSGGAAIGTTALPWSGVDLSNGALIRFNNAYTLTHSTGILTANGSFVASEVRASGDVGGAASQNALTNVSDLTANSTGVGTILFKGATSRNSSGFIKIYIATTAYYVPAFSAITG